MTDTRTHILNIAERLIRAGGYNNCSFREIASEIGIKSASVHHHFPAKEDLAVAVVRRYAEAFFLTLGNAADATLSPEEKIAKFGALFVSAYKASALGCLCGVLASEADLLPASVQKEVVAFVDANLRWLELALSSSNRKPTIIIRQKARLIYTALEGAIAVAKLKNDQLWLDDVSAVIRTVVVPG